MIEKGWAIAWDTPSFTEARKRIEHDRRNGILEFLNPILPSAYWMASQQIDESDTHKPLVFWVVRET